MPAGPTADELAGWAEFRNARTTFRQELVIVAATRDFGVPAFDLFVERAHQALLQAALIANGAVLDGDAAETLRIEAGRPRFTVDMDQETIPLEAGIDKRAISYTKGCYPGQEVIIRIVHRGQGRVAKRLVGLVLSGAEVPPAGALLKSGERDAGRVTSAVWSPRLGAPIALAYALRGFFEPGTELSVVVGGGTALAKVIELPFVAN